MNPNETQNYRCPACEAQARTVMSFEAKVGGSSDSGKLVCSAGHEWEIHDGIPDFTFPRTLGDSDWNSRAHYDSSAGRMYDNAIEWIFRTFDEDESSVRDMMLDKLCVGKEARVLEVGCGTGRDTKPLLLRLSHGELHVLDLSPAMVRYTEQACQSQDGSGCKTHFVVGNCSFLPYADQFFDAAFHFGGLNEFSDKTRALAELSRVVRVGGKVVVGDESMAPWLREREYGKILVNNNPLLAHSLPLQDLPPNCDEVNIRWILGNTFYVIDFRVLEGLPNADFDVPHQGRRGGTCRSRYYGRLEGVTPETKALVEKAANMSGTSIHEWLENVVKNRAAEVISSNPLLK
jgi:ubiquinone/menaquinone biosynthesis C-methylase UbiE